MFLEKKDRQGNRLNDKYPVNYVNYKDMGMVEEKANRLETFLASPDFERHYGGTFQDQYLFLLGNRMKTMSQKEDYEKWYHYCEQGFDGTIVCPNLDKNLKFFNHMNQASIFFFCIYQSDPVMEQTILEALYNKANVIIQLYEENLYLKYAKKYKQATIVLAGREENLVLYETDSFMIDSYNHWKEKVYQK